MRKIKKDNANRTGIRAEMLRISILPILIMALVVIGVSIKAFYGSMTKQIKSEMIDQCEMVTKIYDMQYPGEFGIQMNEDGTYLVLKGDTDISNTSKMLNELKDVHGMEISVFCKGIRVLTTIEDAGGQAMTSTKASPVVQKDIENSKEGQFYKNVTIGSVSYFAYYEPIYLSDGTFYGMIGICRPVAETRAYVYKAIIPIVIVYLLATILIGFVAVWFAKRIIGSIEELQRFMKAVSGANFTVTLDDTVFRQDNELRELAENGKKMQAALRRLVEYDALTGLHNRRYADMQLKIVQKKATEEHMRYCLCIGDIDFFKKVNDTYGHEAGDAVLKAVAKVLKKHMAGNGFVARWGGEEFLMGFVEKSIAQSVSVMEMIMKDMRSLEVPYQDWIIRVTMSMGIAEAEPDSKIDDNLRMADEMLYEAKTSGRDQIKQKKAKWIDEGRINFDKNDNDETI